MIPSRSRRCRSAVLLAAALTAGLVAGPVLVPAAARADAAQAARLVQDANRKIRQHDVAGALKLLEQAVVEDPANVDAHIRLQDVKRDAVGVGPLLAQYKGAADAKPDSPVAQYLATRLLPPAEALAAFERQITQFRDSPWPCAGKARSLELLGRFNEAIATHAEAVARAGAEGVRFEARRAYGYEQSKNWQLAAETWKAVIAKAPADLSAHLGLTEALRQSGSFEESLVALDAAAKVGASEPEVAYRRGLVHMDAHRWDKAVEAFESALQLDRGMLEALCAACDASVRRARATAEAEKRDATAKDFDAAIAFGERASVSFPEAPYAHFVLAAALEAAGWVDDQNWERAAKEYEETLARLPIPGPDKVRALTAKAFVLIHLEQFDSAIDAAQRAIDMDKTAMAAWGHAGYALCAQGKQQDAINRFYKPGLKVDPKCAALNHDLGVALWELKKPNEAKKPLEDARTAEPDVGRYRQTLGELYYELKRYKEACTELHEATELMPREIEAWRSYGRAAYSAKSWDECCRAYEKVCEFDPKTKDEHLYLAAVYAEQKKDLAKAKEHALKFRENGGSDPNLDDWLNQLLGGGAPAGGGD